MGGYGSGRQRYYSAKSAVEDCCALDVNWMTREGMFDSGGWRSGSIRWSNSHTGEQTSSIGYEVNFLERWIRPHYRKVCDDEQLDYKVPLTTTELLWGGVRWWFVCALKCDGRYCGRRVSKLYLPPGWAVLQLSALLQPDLFRLVPARRNLGHNGQSVRHVRLRNEARLG